MAKWFGKIGYGITAETDPGIWEETIVEHEYYGEVMNLKRALQSNPDSVNDNIVVRNIISIIADPFANENFCNILYVEFMGTKWKVSDVEVQHPRLLLTLGGVYNG